VIPKTSKKERLSENINIYDFNLSDDDYKKLDDLDCGIRFFDPINMENFGNIPYW
jgi:diketogulonate reductase-like aldo/keto reductase